MKGRAGAVAAETFGGSSVLPAGVENVGGITAGVVDDGFAANDGELAATAALAISFFGDHAGAGGEAAAR
jgi:hypothetical protein